ncbi:leucine-rich repeat-containing protein 45 [Trichonephila inaurata madagascariensis]|uniref:Leucine-rich repeat-containing protein 45 n=1 Tax=Trichonephila inaurata madagascariensis TaxID=2747483 RepID=A0A8X6YDM1_9ARAC|nr:leucine-rich repeat-containing protein 45 [Trichonephila inaurata madagascariensis]
MESFKFLYLEACENLNTNPCETLLSRIEDVGNSNSFNLLGIQLTNETCKAFGQALNKDVHIQELDCSNCMFSEEGLVSILLGLEKNKFLLTLNLKGNNIRSSGTEVLGKFLRHNSHLQNLCLEWNGLGIFPEKFYLFCEALCLNNSLKFLDLRNNQLNHVCAQAISDVILRNSSLQKLDFANNEYIARSKFLSSKLKEKEEERNIQVKSLMEQLEKMDKDASMTERLDKQEVKRNLLESLGSLKEENLFLKEQIQDLKISQSHSFEQISKLQDAIAKLENASKQDQELFKNKTTQLNERHAEIMKENAALHKKEQERILKQKISLLESQKNDLEQELKEKTSQVFSERKHAEEMQIHLEKKLKADHLHGFYIHSNKNLFTHRKLIRQQLEERIAMLEDANKEQNDHLQKDLQVLYQLKTDITGLDLELSEQSHEIQHLKKCLEEKDAEMKIKEAKIRLEVKEQLDELSRAKEKIEDINQKNDLLQQKMKEMDIKHKEELNSKADIIQNLTLEIQQYQYKIKEIKEVERDRTLQLQKAFEEYLKPSVHIANENAVPSGDMPLLKNEL